MRIKEFRNRMGLSQRVVSEKIGIPQTTLFSYEKGINEPNLVNLNKLADFYHVSVDELIGRPTSIINKLALSDQEREVIEKFLSLTNKQKSLVEIYINTLTKDI